MSKICCVGDIMLGENTHHYRRGIPRVYAGKYPDLISEDTASLINDTDVFLANFESSLCSDSEYVHLDIEDCSYRAPLSSLELFKKIDCPIVLNVANNHFEQYGGQSTQFSLNHLKDAGIEVTGTSSHPTIIELEKTRILVWGVTLIEDRCDSQYTFKATPRTLTDSISIGDKREGDVWILSIHWGEEYLTLPNTTQKELSHKLHNMGFDVVIGHHPHVIQPITASGKKYTIFSLGNFIFDQNFSYLTRRGMLCSIDLDDMEISPFFNIQKHYSVSTKRSSLKEINDYCMKRFGKLTPLRMRILMKFELLCNIHKSNFATVKYFAKKTLGKAVR